MPRKIDSELTAGEPQHGKKPNQKIKPYVVMQYLLKYSDENHPMTAYDIIGFLNECGIDAERRSIYRDIDDINKVYLMMEENCSIDEAEEMLEEDETLKVIVYDKAKKGFYVQQRHFELDDIRLLAECVYSAKFIEQGQANRLVDVVTEFVSEDQANTIRHDALLTDRVKTNNKSVLNNLHTISDALSKQLDGQKHLPEKITFKYLKYTIQNLDKPTERHDGARYSVSPYRLLISDGNYYLLGFDDDRQKMLTFRVDRMRDVRLTGEKRDGEEAAAAIEINRYSQQCFSMFGGESTRVRIQFVNDLLDTIIDRFGKTGAVYEKMGEEHFAITADVKVSGQFFSWLCSFDNRAKLIFPDSVIAKFKDYLDSIREMY